MKPKDHFPKNFEAAFIEFFKKIVEGYRFIKQHREIIAPFVLLLAIQISVAVIIVNVPALATQVLKISLVSAGLLIVVPAGIGAGLGALALFALVISKSYGQEIIQSSSKLIR